MAIQRYEPTDFWTGLQQQLDELLGSDGRAETEGSNVATSQWMPLVDLKEEPDRFLIRADIPGVEPQDIEVSMDNGVLTIRGERAEDKAEERTGYHRIERARGSFYRRFTLPDVADEAKIAARSRLGVLEIEVPKKNLVKARKIEIKG